jgi:hypothetical protein
MAKVVTRRWLVYIRGLGVPIGVSGYSSSSGEEESGTMHAPVFFLPLTSGEDATEWRVRENDIVYKEQTSSRDQHALAFQASFRVCVR